MTSKNERRLSASNLAKIKDSMLDPNSLFSGTLMIKYCKKPNKAPHQRLFKFEVERRLISWRSPSKRNHRTTISVDDIKEVRRGQKTEAFTLFPWSEKEDYSFSIIHGVNFASLDLICNSPEEREVWVSTVLDLMKATDNIDEEVQLQNYLKQTFNFFDRNGDNKLDQTEIFQLLRSYNVNIPKKQLAEILSKVDVDKNGTLDFNEFSVFYKKLRYRSDIRAVFKTIEKNEHNLSIETIQKFCTDIQKLPAQKKEYFDPIVRRYTQNGEMTLDGFVRFLEGSYGNIFVPEKQIEYQDMTQPLCRYYINSSHNTYLLGDQLRGKSSVEAYIRALQLGCRCVELDCWDGGNNEPQIYHGRTLTTRIFFRDVIEAVRKYAFVSSPYPVILSFENHCSIPQQKVIARYLLDILGDYLLKEPLRKGEEQLPSPEELKYKILIKGKKIPPALNGDASFSTIDDDLSLVDDSDEEDDDFPLTPNLDVSETSLSSEGTLKEGDSSPVGAHVKELSDSSSIVRELDPITGKTITRNLNSNNNVPSDSKSLRSLEDRKKRTFDKRRSTSDFKSTPFESTTTSSINVLADKSFTLDKKKKDSKSASMKKGGEDPSTMAFKAKKKLAEELSDLVIYTKAVNRKTIETPGRFDEMSSFGERKSERFCQTQMALYEKYNRNQLSRIYPAPWRTDSSNLDPRVHWNAGCQLVALNYQTPDRSMQLNYGRFEENGRCGYCLKPEFLQKEDGRRMPPQKLTLRVISGQQLPRPIDYNKDKIISPCVEVEVVGADADTKKQRTPVILENGWNCVWDKELEFEITVPELALIRFVVYDSDEGGKKEEFVATFTVPFLCMGAGYRHVTLLDAQLNRVPMSSLFVNVKTSVLLKAVHSQSDLDTLLRAAPESDLEQN